MTRQTTVPGARPLAAITLASALLLAACGGKSDDELLASAKADMDKRDYAAAVLNLKTVLQGRSPSSEARFLLGVALLEQGQPAAALTELRKAEELKFDPDRLAPKLARALLANGRFKEVSDSYSQQQIKPAAALAELRVSVAASFALQNKRAETEAALAEAFDAVPNFGPALLLKARLVAARGQIDEALQVLERAQANGAPIGESMMLRGDLLLRAKRDEAAAVKAFEAAVKDPQHALSARLALFNLAVRNKSLAAAQAQLAELKKAFPTSPQTNLADALVAMLQKDYKRADETVVQLLRLAPGNPQLLILGGALDLQLGKLLAAETKLGRAVQASERMVPARQMLAEVYLRMGQPAKSLGALRPLLEDPRTGGDTLALAAQAHLQLGDPVRAETLFNAAAKLRPDDVQIKTALALTDVAKGQADTGIQTLQQIAKTDAGDTADLALISTLMRRRELDSALSAIAALDKKQAGKPVVSLLRAQVLRAKGDTTGARAAFEAALTQAPGHAASVLGLAELDIEAGQPQQAKVRLEQILKANPRVGAVRLALVQVEKRMGATADVVKQILTDGTKADPTDAVMQAALINHLNDSKDFKAAVEAGQAAQIVTPNEPQVLDALGVAQAGGGDNMQAAATFGKLATLLPTSPGPHLRMAALHQHSGNTAARIASLKKAWEVAPDAPEVHRQWLALVNETKDPQVALSAARDQQRSRPAHASGFMLEGDLLASRKDWAAAHTAYRQAATKKDHPAVAPVRAYAALKQAGKAADADRFAAEWARAHPQDVGFLLQMGGLAMAGKDYPAAERWHGEVLKLSPGHATALNNQAWLLTQRRAPGALAMAERAAKVAPGSAAVLDTLAGALAQEGQLPRAIEVQAQAVSLDGRSPGYRLRLAELHIKAGQTTPAREQLKRLASQSGDWVGKNRAAELLKSVGP